jgi:hypothetical protein
MAPEQTDGSNHPASPLDPTRRARSLATTPQPEPDPQGLLHFDAIDDFPGFDGSTSWADVAPSQPDWEARSRARSARPRSRRGPPTFRTSKPTQRRWGAGVAAAALVIVAAVVGLTLAGAFGSHGRRPAPSSHTTSPPPTTAAPVASAPTSPTTAAPTAMLVASSAGSSTYRVDASATITFRAGTGTCWVEIRQSGRYGPVMFSGDLLAGQSRAVNGPIWVRLGNPSVITVTVNGAPISPPGMTTGEPYDLMFA